MVTAANGSLKPNPLFLRIVASVKKGGERSFAAVCLEVGFAQKAVPAKLGAIEGTAGLNPLPKYPPTLCN